MSGGAPFPADQELNLIKEFRSALIGFMSSKIDLFNDTALVACLLDPRTKNCVTAQLYGLTVAHLDRAANLLTAHI